MAGVFSGLTKVRTGSWAERALGRTWFFLSRPGIWGSVFWMRRWKNDFLNWLCVFVPCFVAFNMLAEVGLSFVPKAEHAQVGLSWIVSGVAMMLWGYFGDWEGY